MASTSVQQPCSLASSSLTWPRTIFILIVCLPILWTDSWQPDKAPPAAVASAFSPLYVFQTPSFTSVPSSSQSQPQPPSSSRLFLAKPQFDGSKRKANMMENFVGGVVTSSSKEENDKNVDNLDDETSKNLPANLRRKVKASRPPLGHVVPEQNRQRKGSGGSANPRLRSQGKAREAGLNNPSMLRIFGGTARGRRLDSPSVYLRPMMGKVREAVYSTLLSFGLYDFPVRHLDLFAGSGSIGLESMSRGAKHCTFCDLSPDCCSAISRNIGWCGFGDDENDYTSQVVCADVLQLLRNPTSVGISDEETFNIITMGPPYEEVVYADLLEAVAGSSIIQDDTIVVVEYPVELWGDLPHVYTGERTTMVGVRNRKYGRTVIAMYICNPTGRIENAESRPEEFI